MSLEGKTPEEVNSLAALSDALLSDPNTRREYQRLLKKQNPKLSLPEIDTEDRVEASVKPLREQIEKNQAEQQINAAQAAASALFEGLRDNRVVSTRKEFTELVKYANEKGFQTNDAGLTLAAAHRQDEMAPAEPTPHSAALAHLVPKENKDLMRDPQGWARNTANAAMADIIKNRGRAAA